MPYATGKDSRAMCARCGTKDFYRRLKQEWTGLWVCPHCFDIKHEQLEPIRRIGDPVGLDHPYPDTDVDGTVATQLEDVLYKGIALIMHFGAKT